MRRRLFNAWCVISVMVVALLCTGLIAQLGFEVIHTSTLSIKGCQIRTERGRVVCYFEALDASAIAAKSLPRSIAVPGFHSLRYFHLFPLALPELRRSIWKFDAHSLTSEINTPGMRIFILACPIWVACVPFLIAPAIWFIDWRKRQRQIQNSRSGFSVVATGT